MNELNIICMSFISILLIIVWLIKFFFQERFIFNKLIKKKFNSISWYKFFFVYGIIELSICSNNTMFLLDKIFMPFTIMFSILTIFLCNSSFEEISEIKSDPDYEIQKKIWLRNRKIDKML